MNIDPPEKFELSATERSSPVWQQKLLPHWKARLATLRAMNDANLTADETANLRGRIAEVKALIALDSPIDTSLPDTR